MAVANYISRKRQSEIDSLIDEILVSTGKSYPEDSVIDIIKGYIPDVSILEYDFGGDKSIRGAIYKESESFSNIIAIQKDQSGEAKNFALAHEFGHYSLNHEGDANFMIDQAKYDGSEEQQREAEAQYFAASLLMPREKFIHLMKYLSVTDLAARFGVTQSAVRVRKAWLDGSGRESAL